MFDLEFTPQSDEAIEILEAQEAEERLLSEGEGVCEVISSTAKVSQNGNKMIVLKLKVWDCNGKQGWIDDYWIVGEKSFFMKRIKNGCEGFGILDKYKTGKLNASDINNSHTSKIIIGKRKDKNGKLQNNIVEYIKKTDEQNTTKTEFNDDIPW